MCGVAGFLGASRTNPGSSLKRMSTALQRRGPDGEGVWIDEKLEVGLAHRRLTLVDLSDSGAQPMVSRNGRYVIAFNGEIYNHREIRKKYFSEAGGFRGTSDTEVLLRSIEAWGLHRTLSKLVGMFAFALLDRLEERVFLVRDRLGEKPLYFGQQGSLFCFASEPAGIIAHPDWKQEINPKAVNELVLYGRIAAPDSIYTSMQKLEPGCMVDVKKENGIWNLGKTFRWWDYGQILREAGSDNSRQIAGYAKSVEEILNETIAGQLDADVPVGAFLSGGIDSSTIASLAAAQSSRRLNTFTVGFSDKDYDESKKAAKIAKHLGTEHHELLISSSSALELVEALPEMYSEPFADSSQIPTAMISRYASNHVKAVLSGDGGDEVFGGYNRYVWLPRLQRIGRLFSQGVKNRIGEALMPGTRSSQSVLSLAGSFARFSNARQSQEKSQKALFALFASNELNAYEQMLRTGPMAHLVCYKPLSEGSSNRPKRVSTSGSYVERMQYWDTMGYLPDDILVKVDRASMYHGLEARLPFLDHRLLEFMSQVPVGAKVIKGQRKPILRKLASRYIPEELLAGSKSGFAVPVGAWLRGPLREWGDDLLSESQLRRENFFDVSLVRKIWDQHQRQIWDHNLTLWAILMFQQWKNATQP